MSRTQTPLFSTYSCVFRSLVIAPFTRNSSIRNGANGRDEPVTLVQPHPQPTIALRFRLVPDFLARIVIQVARDRCQTFAMCTGPRRGFKHDYSQLNKSRLHDCTRVDKHTSDCYDDASSPNDIFHWVSLPAPLFRWRKIDIKLWRCATDLDTVSSSIILNARDVSISHPLIIRSPQ